jgi:hypothetical protein
MKKDLKPVGGIHCTGWLVGWLGVKLELIVGIRLLGGAQMTAANELHRLSWRFHMQRKQWFHRVDEPSVQTEDFEKVGGVGL